MTGFAPKDRVTHVATPHVPGVVLSTSGEKVTVRWTEDDKSWVNTHPSSNIHLVEAAPATTFKLGQTVIHVATPHEEGTVQGFDPHARFPIIVKWHNTLTATPHDPSKLRVVREAPTPPTIQVTPAMRRRGLTTEQDVIDLWVKHEDLLRAEKRLREDVRNVAARLRGI